jgi:hypothetical protein
LLPPLTPLAMRGSLRERLLPAPGQDDRDALAVAQMVPVMVESQPQHTVSTAAAPPTVASIDATLLAAHRQLNNPPLSEASPSAAEQWHHDVDQLIVTTINTSPQERQRQPSTQYSHTPSVARVSSVAHALSVVCAPPMEPNARPSVRYRAPMVSYATVDLRAEINRCHGGEDSRITIERQCERRRNIEGRNLEKDFDSHTPVHGSPTTRVPCPLSPREF